MRIAVLFLWAGLSLATESNWAEQYRHGTEFLRRQSYREARQCFERVTRLHPRFAEGYFYLGISALHSGDPKAAEAALRQAVLLDRSAVSALYNLGVLLLDEKKPAEAADYFEKARQAGPLSQELAVNLIRARLESQQQKRALDLVESASRQFAGEAGFHAGTGKLLLEHGLPSASCSELSVANQLAPRQVEIAIPLSAACLAANEVAIARSALSSIAEESTGNAEYHSLAAQVFLRTGEKDTALREINFAVRLQPQNPVYLLQLGRLYQKNGDQEKALQSLEKAASIDPNLPDIQYSMAVTYITQENEPKAIELLRGVLKLAPHFDRALFFLGSIYLAGDHLDQADGPLTEALRLQPRNPFYHCFVGMLRIRQLRQEDAETQFRLAAELDPSYAPTHFHLGRLLARMKRNAEAEAELEKSVSLQPDLAEAHYELGLLLRKIGKPEQSDQALARFKALRAAEESERAIVLKELQDTVH